MHAAIPIENYWKQWVFFQVSANKEWLLDGHCKLQTKIAVHVKVSV